MNLSPALSGQRRRAKVAPWVGVFFSPEEIRALVRYVGVRYELALGEIGDAAVEPYRRTGWAVAVKVGARWVRFTVGRDVTGGEVLAQIFRQLAV